ncbi:MAG: DUF1996 domain-containing protein, partial [Acidimicrobiales bacterium]
MDDDPWFEAEIDGPSIAGVSLGAVERERGRLPARLLAVLTVAAVVAALASVTMTGDDGDELAAVDPETGYPWCADPSSDGADNRLGDGLGLENGKLCRTTGEAPQEAPRTDDGAVDDAGAEVHADLAPPTTAEDAASAPDEPSPEEDASTATDAHPASSDEPEASHDTAANDTASDGTAPSGGAGSADAHGAGSGSDAAPSGGDGAGDAGNPGARVVPTESYRENLELIQAQQVRNTNRDGSADLGTPSSDLVIADHLGPRSAYLDNPGGNPEQSFPFEQGGQFRVGCEFSHFAYDDPLVFPGQPGASHLHMFFGNTDTNAFSTADSILNSGGGTCNGEELNRTGYWAPAMFDGQGNVRIPERIVVYYKGEGLANGAAEPFPEGAAMIASTDLNTVSTTQGGAEGARFTYTCSNNYSGPASPASNTMANCDGNEYLNQYGTTDPHVVLEMNVKFPQGWNGEDPTNQANYRHPTNGVWYYSLCDGEFDNTLVKLENFNNYRVDAGESTGDWYLASDVYPVTRNFQGPGGRTVHADWWSGWNPEVN